MPDPLQYLTRLDVKDKRGRHVVIRPIAVDDARSLKFFFDSLSQHSRSTFQPHPFTAHFAEKIAQDANARHHLRMVVLDQSAPQKIVGYAFLTRPPFLGQFGYFGIAVTDAYQGRGISTLLMNTLFEYAHEQDVQRVYLNVFSENITAQQAYSKVGFLPLATPPWWSKVCTLYELWYNQQLLETIFGGKKRAKKKHHESTSGVRWMSKKL